MPFTRPRLLLNGVRVGDAVEGVSRGPLGVCIICGDAHTALASVGDQNRVREVGEEGGAGVKHLIGLYGEQGVGKSTLAAQLRPLGFRVEPLARVLKEMTAPLERYMSAVEKNEDCPLLGFSQRRLQQLMGTEVGRALNPDLWIRVMEARTKYVDRVVIDDVRFDNEMLWILEQGGTLIHVKSDEFKTEQVSDHESEAYWMHWEPDYVYYNSSNTEENEFLRLIREGMC